MESEVDSIRGGDVWIGACANIQQQPKRTGGSRIEERAIRKGLAQELLYAQDTVLCSYFAQREGATNGDKGRRSMAAKCSKDWTDSDEYLGVTMRWGLKRKDRMRQAQAC